MPPPSQEPADRVPRPIRRQDGPAECESQADADVADDVGVDGVVERPAGREHGGDRPCRFEDGDGAERRS
jgi:hypothetical protein